jgi:hypothetical protein
LSVQLLLGAKVFVLGDLRRDRDPPGGAGTALEGAKQNSLANPAEPGDEHRLLRVAAPQPLKEDLEALEFGVAADKCRRWCAGVRGVGIHPRIHSGTLYQL